MSESIRRRNSSKQLLQNLIRVTAQRSQEDAEEVERERRRRARERERGEPHQHSNLTHKTESDDELKPSGSVLEEDEGFSDWSHRLENRNEQEVQEICRAKEQKASAPAAPGENKQLGTEEEDREEREPRSSEEASAQHPEKTSSPKSTSRASYSSSVFVSQDARLQHAAGQPADRTSYLAAGTMKPRGGACRMHGEMEEDEVTPALERERVETRRSSGDEEEQEEEELSFTRDDQEGLHIRSEERHEGGDEEEEEEQNETQTHRLVQLTESGFRPESNKVKERTSEVQPDGSSRDSESLRAEVHRRMSEEASSRSSGSLFNSSEGEESLNCYGPMSPTFKKLLIQFYPDEVNTRVSADGRCAINERTESLRRSTSSSKKTLPPLYVPKIDKRLERYAQVLEVSSKEGRSSCQAPTDLMCPSEPVASKKNLFEAGEAWNQNAASVAQSKDADGLKVGVAGLINQWVKGGEDGSSSSSPSKPAEIRAGGVLHKKNLWESLGDSFPSAGDGKENSTKRYKFVVMGHGKYTKVSSDDGCTEDLSCPAAGQVCDDL